MKVLILGSSLLFGLVVAVIVYAIGQVKGDWEVRH